jgi:hypothetical protein
MSVVADKRQDVVSRLAAAGLGATVLDSHPGPLEETMLPALVVHTDSLDEIPRNDGGGIPSYNATFEFVIEGHVSDDTGGPGVTAELRDVLIESAVDALLTDAEFVQQWSKVGNLRWRMGVSLTGDRRIGVGLVSLELVTQIKHEPSIVSTAGNLETVHVDGDQADPISLDIDLT